ncbi:MAG: trypsin-like peptidase domain-containing protein [Chloroflexota bacterium]|nr:trypsin-like peptidase domain-containing protein [Chloroflexota bacterium]
MEETVTNALRSISSEIAALVEMAAPSVLRVEARRRFPATGIAWAENLVVTAHHAVEIEDDITIGTPDGGRLAAKLLGRDPRNDLALLSVDGSLRPAIPSGDEELRVGNLVFALGRPRQQINVAFGIVSGLVNPANLNRRRRRMKQAFANGKGDKRAWKKSKWKWKKWMAWEGESWGMLLTDRFIQTDVTMYPGFSGGPLLGADGALHGMNTSGFGGGVSAAVPVDVLRKSVAALLSDGAIKTGYLGIGVQTAQLPDSVAESLGQDAGLLVVSTEADSPAATAGMLVGDILTALDGESVEHIDELQVTLARLELGSEVSTRFVRGGEIREGSVVVREK